MARLREQRRAIEKARAESRRRYLYLMQEESDEIRATRAAER
jgi:hypothetical protein